MKNVFIRTLIALALVCVCEQVMYAQEVTKKDLEEMKERIEQIDKKVDNGNETLKAAKEYSENADKLTDRFLAIIALFLAILAAAGIASFIAAYRNAVKRYEGVLKKEFEEYKVEIRSMLEGERQKQAIFDNTKILVISKREDEENQPHKMLEKKFGNGIQLTHANEQFQLKENVSFDDFEVIIIDNQHIDGYNWNFSIQNLKDELIKLIGKTGDGNLVYYGSADHDGQIGKTSEWIAKKTQFKASFSNGLDTLENSIIRLVSD